MNAEEMIAALRGRISEWRAAGLDPRKEAARWTVWTRDEDASGPFASSERPAASVRAENGAVSVSSALSGRGMTLLDFVLSLQGLFGKLRAGAQARVGRAPVLDFSFDPLSRRARVSWRAGTLTESVMDRPRGGLDPAFWDGEGKDARPRPDVAEALAAVVDWAKGRLPAAGFRARVVGSICSDCWGPGSDVDVHFGADAGPFGTEDELKDFQDAFEDAFFDRFGEEGTYLAGGHPVGVYFQPNEYQDEMSQGCYDLLAGEWVVGPSVGEAPADPWAAWYVPGMSRAADAAAKAREAVLRAYEEARALLASSDPAFRRDRAAELRRLADDGIGVLKAAKRMRTVASSPRSSEDARRLRTDPEWKAADASLKLLDRLGYLPAMKALRSLKDVPAEAPPAVLASKALRGIEGSLGKALADAAGGAGAAEAAAEAPLRPEALAESLPRAVAAAARPSEAKAKALASFMWMPGLLPAERLAEELASLPPGAGASSPEAMAAVGRASGGRLGDCLAANAAARAAYLLCRGLGGNSRRTALGCLLNQAGGDPKKVGDALSRPGSWPVLGKGGPEGWFCPVRDLSDPSAAAEFWEARALAAALLLGGLGPAPKGRNVARRAGKGGMRLAESVTEDGLESGYLQEFDGTLLVPGTYERVGEGLGSAFRSAVAAGLFAAGALGSGQAAASVQRAARPAAAQKARPSVSYAGLSRENMVNLLATIAYNEAMQDWMKNRNDDAIIAILNVIDNRAGGDPAHYAEEISAKSQFFSASHVKGGYTDGTYAAYSPQAEAKAAGGQLSPKQKECWDLCVRYAGMLLDKKLPRKIGDRNMIANPGKDRKSALDSWGNGCDLAIEGHRFGYDERHDGYIKYGKKKQASAEAPKALKIHVVKKGDSLWSLAKAYGTTVDEIKSNNGLKGDVIRPGQKLKV